MESALTFICQNAHDAHWIIFGLLMLAGLNVPISEDILLLTGGAIASTCIPEHTVNLFIWVYLGCWLSAWEAYWVGRLLGPKLYTIKWFSRILTPKRIEKLHYYYEKFGIFTFIVGRFIPGGVRNALFMSSGLGKMPFPVFIARDGLACLISSTTIFTLGFKFAEHYQLIVNYYKKYDLIIIGVIALIITITVAIVAYKKYFGDNTTLAN